MWCSVDESKDEEVVCTVVVSLIDGIVCRVLETPISAVVDDRPVVIEVGFGD